MVPQHYNAIIIILQLFRQFAIKTWALSKNEGGGGGQTTPTFPNINNI
jgi:hypothetical protein